ncbi:MAG: hypothetical protein HQL83_01940 [Magnetococcales bacterium]|nr:hypothetical protein [Magnetococcales bacterium]MBF0347167.1 hypothetical protein [Magnetococcales bacterium]
MTTENKSNSELLHQAMADFKEAVRLRNALHIRVASRVTTLLRVGMVSLAVVAVVFFVLLWTVSSKLDMMINVMEVMNHRFTNMAKDMSVMRGMISGMEKNMASMPTIVDEVGSMQKNVAVMNPDIQQIAKQMQLIEKNLGGITQAVGHMTQTFSAMEFNVQEIDKGVNRTARPMKLFNQFSPLP